VQLAATWPLLLVTGAGDVTRPSTVCSGQAQTKSTMNKSWIFYLPS
jgi:hypothetical protein